MRVAANVCMARDPRACQHAHTRVHGRWPLLTDVLFSRVVTHRRVLRQRKNVRLGAQQCASAGPRPPRAVDARHFGLEIPANGVWLITERGRWLPLTLVPTERACSMLHSIPSMLAKAAVLCNVAGTCVLFPVLFWVWASGGDDAGKGRMGGNLPLVACVHLYMCAYTQQTCSEFCLFPVEVSRP